jgi:hypothetical protein
MVVLLVLITTIGTVVSGRRSHPELPGDSPQQGRREIADVRDALDELSVRLGRLEEERDFYKELLEAPEKPHAIKPPGTQGEASESDAR